MKKNIFLFLFLSLFSNIILVAQNALFIPDTLSGTTFNLNVQKGSKVFYPGFNTTTYGYNGAFLGPTLIMRKGDSVTLNVTNNLPAEKTTVHWHGLHVAAKNDGTPYQAIGVGETWRPSFKVRNNAATFWYHPHIHPKTEFQVGKGLAGMIIVRDSIEATYNLPRRYNVDDFPLIVQCRIFDVYHQIGVATHDDTTLMVNGTIDPYLKVPKQVVRFRLLNGSADRSYNFGLSTNANFYVIASDGGLLSKPYSTKRMVLSPGERAELLIDFSKDTIGQKTYLMSYASELPRGVIGADSVGTSTLIIQDGYYQNHLNGRNFNLLRFDVGAATANPVTTIPTAFAPVTPISASLVNENRSITFYPDTVTSGKQGYVDGPFLLNNDHFEMSKINITTYLNNVEIWTFTNKTMVAHPFHIHDIQFFVLDINGNPPPPELSGLKDVILVKPNDVVRVITKFETFADKDVPYMYHCHLLHHEDDGMMGTFVVLDTTKATGIPNKINLKNNLTVFQNFSSNELTINLLAEKRASSKIYIIDALGRKQMDIWEGNLQQGENNFKANIDKLSSGIYFVIATGDQLQWKKIVK
ncbi:MAG: multicopper oxidase domain-containing protein [Bacteroidia bacterium]